jgi:hypothetical protein
MKYDVNQVEDIALETTTLEEDMELSADSTAIIFQMFSKNIYSNAIGSVVREITSNCFDSHVEAKTDFPVVIRKNVDKLTGEMSISFIDFGVGMSPERITKIYRKYFKSTKRDSNDQIGCFGLGSKTPLAYKRSTGHGVDEYDNSYQVVTIFDGIKYSYLVYEGERKFPKITLQYQGATTEGNGTEVRVPILTRDLYNFEREMIKQLYYFENIVFEGFEDEDGKSSLSNEYQIVRGKNFLFRGHQYSEYMHICLGRVAYPIDYGILNLSERDYRIPIALKFEVGDLNVNVSRESIDYNESTIKMITKKLEEAKDEIKEMLAKQYDNVCTLEDYFNVKADFGKLLFSNGQSVSLGNLISKNEVNFVNFKYANIIKMPDDKNLFNFFFENRLYGKKPSESNGYRRRRRYSSAPVIEFFEGGYESLLKNPANVLFHDGMFNRKVLKQAYLKFTYSTYFIVTKKELAYSLRTDIADLFSVSLDRLTGDDGKLLPFVQTMIEMQNDYFEIVRKHVANYEEVEIPESFVITRKRQAVTEEMRKITISVRLFNQYSRDNQKRIKLDQLFNFKEPIFYCTKEEKNIMYNAVQVFRTLFKQEMIVGSYDNYENKFQFESKGKIMFLVVSQNNIKYLSFCKDARPLKSIYPTLFYRKVDMVSNYFQSFNLIQSYEAIRSLYKHKSFGEISKKWADKVTEIKEFIATLNCKNQKIGNNKYNLDTYFNTASKEMTPAQKKIAKYIKEIEGLEKKNGEVLRYIELPYRESDSMESIQINILKKVMVF